MVRWRPLAVSAMLVLGLVLTGCGAMAEEARGNDLCAQYDELVKAADQVRELDPAEAKAAQLEAAAMAFRDSLNQVQAVAEGRLDTAASNLEAALGDLRVAATEASAEARETLIPQWEDDLQAVAELWAVLQELVAYQCSDQSS